MFRPRGNRAWQTRFGFWAFIGTSGAASGSIHAESLTRSEVILPTPAPSIALIFPPMFSLLEQSYPHERQRQNNADTVSETVS
jgi:hypothetical protein